MTGKFRYAAFITYSHRDKTIAGWLHRALERYRIPKRLVGVETPRGIIPKRFQPLFRDREELSASTDLTKSVKQALSQSEFLIVVCSPDAAKSKWVNQEILEFKKLRGEEHILCLIVSGEPFAAGGTRSKGDECFPKALHLRTGSKGRRKQNDFEPIAADARPQGDGKRLAKLKIVAGMLGIDLGTLVQRESQRRQRQMMAVSFGSLAGVVILGGLLFITLEAKRDAEQKRAQAEGLVEFMIEDLKGPLDSVGNLQLLDSVGREVLDFYASLDPGEMDDDALARRSRALLIIGDMEDLRGNLDAAHEAFTAAYQTTEELLARDPDNPTRIFDHSQSSYYVGYLDWRRGNLDEAEGYLRDYSNFSRQLLDLEPDNPDYLGEVGYSHSNLGTLYDSRGNYSDAAQEYEKAKEIFEQLVASDENPLFWKLQLAQALAWLSDSYENLWNLQAGVDYRVAELGIYTSIQETDPGNLDAREALVVTNRALGRLYLSQGKVKLAEEYFEKAINLGENLSVFDPENTLWAERLTVTYFEYMEILVLRNNFTKARENLTKAIKTTKDLMTRDSTVIKWKVDLHYRGLLLSAALAQATEDYTEGLETAKRATAGLTILRGENPTNKDILELLGDGYFLSGELHDALGQREEAIAAWEKTVTLLTPYEQEITLGTRDILARVHLRLGQRESANSIADELRRVGYRHPGFTSYWQKWGNQ